MMDDATERSEFAAVCEASGCDNDDWEQGHCEGCSCCQECCNCGDTDCDCDACIDRRVVDE